MTEPTPDGVTPEETPAATEPPAPTAEDIAKLQTALDKERAARKEYERQVKEFDSQRKASMTEAERAVAEAEERGRAAVRAEYGSRLAQTEFKAAAAARNPEYDVAKALKYVNLSSFLGEDGEPDTKAIAAAAADLIPTAGSPQPPSFDGGTRQSAPAGVSMSDLIRQAAGRG
jgi:hypothetical protein